MKVFHCRLFGMQCNAGLLNVIQLGVGFLLLFTAFQSCGNIQEYVITSITLQQNGTGSTIDPQAGYNSLAIIYGVFTGFNFFAPPIVNKLTEKWSMVAGGVTYLLFLLSFLKLTNAIFYTCSALLGVGAAIIWVGQGSYLTKNSDDETIGRNSGIFWALLQCSLPVGGIFLYTQLRSDTTSVNLSTHTIEVIYVCFSVLAALGIVVLVLLRKPPATQIPEGESPIIAAADDDSPQVDSVSSRQSLNKSTPPSNPSLVATFVRILQLLKTVPMILLAFVFVYTGFELTFWSGVYGTSIANTLAFSTPSKELLALNIIFIGFGEILGGGIFGLFGKKFNQFGRNPIIFLAMMVHLVVFFLIYLNIPGQAPVGPTKEVSYLTPNEYLALFCGFIIGFGDACWNTQVYSLLGSMYVDDSAAAFGLFKFFQSGAACAGFFYSGKILLQWQLLIMALLCPIATLSFFQVEWKAQAIALHHEKHP